MLKQKSNLTLAVVLVAATLLVAGGVAVASNTGFKINKPLQPVPVPASGDIGNNWVSIPYFNPYGNGTNLCAQLGLVSTGITRGNLLKLNPVDGSAPSANCGTSQANTFVWDQGQGVRIRNAGTGAPTSAIIVGSHNPAMQLTIPQPQPAPANPNIGTFWLAVPYHTTWVTAADICGSFAMTATGISRGSVGRLNAVTGTFTSANCGTTGAGTLNLVLGEAVRVREPLKVIVAVPPHY